jgi:hypothetical protein
MDKIDENMDQFLADLHLMKANLRVQGAATSGVPTSSDMDDMRLKIDMLVARLQVS